MHSLSIGAILGRLANLSDSDGALRFSVEAEGPGSGSDSGSA